MVTSIASASIGMSNSRTITKVNVSVMDKVLDTAENQGQVILDMIDAVPTSDQLLDVYA